VITHLNLLGVHESYKIEEHKYIYTLYCKSASPISIRYT